MGDTSAVHKEEWDLSGLVRLGIFIKEFGIEFWRGVTTKTLPWPICCGIGVVFSTIFTLRYDAYAWRFIGMAKGYPFHPLLYWTYVTIYVSSGFWIWTIGRVFSRRELVKTLSSAFHNAGLLTRTGRFPGFVSDEKLDTHMRKLVVTAVGLPESEFKKARPSLEAALQVFIDQIKSRVERGTVELLYAYMPLLDHIDYDPLMKVAPLTFMVGMTRSKPLLISLREVPHILAGGYTNSGKSAFVRQLLMTLTLNNPDVEFTLIDLKSGLELGIFDGMPNVRLYITPAEAIKALQYVEAQLEKRMGLLRANRANDFDAFYRIPEEKRKYTAEWPKGKVLVRHVLTIDEAAELFMASGTLAAKDAQVARRLTAKIAALGRAVGIHLIIATQRPDRNAVDPLIKSNLQGRLCFQMSDNASSMTILDSVRAADPPPTKGRAIWRSGFDLIEVQVPWLDRDAMALLLEPFKKKGEAVGSTANGTDQSHTQVSAASKIDDGVEKSTGIVTTHKKLEVALLSEENGGTE
ncbi:FtsK/SpoIIIE domain-containing protein [Bdellovibrionota bacterium FG-1]